MNTSELKQQLLEEQNAAVQRREGFLARARWAEEQAQEARANAAFAAGQAEQCRALLARLQEAPASVTPDT
jgi:hypothetical protein